MTNYRLHGESPYLVTAVHGGPGAAGDAYDLATELGKITGTIEPFQTEPTIAGQIAELTEVIKRNCQSPVTLIGHSWGAWLVYLFAAQHPELVAKLILVGSGPFHDRYARQIMPTRLKRLTAQHKAELDQFTRQLEKTRNKTPNEVFSQLGKLLSQADSFDPLPESEHKVAYNYAIFNSVWHEAARLRSSETLLKAGHRITCPVIAIHGDHDPHPAAGVKIPLGTVLHDFTFVKLPHCGHKPWVEKQAKDAFFALIKSQLGLPTTAQLP